MWRDDELVGGFFSRGLGELLLSLLADHGCKGLEDHFSRISFSSEVTGLVEERQFLVIEIEGHATAPLARRFDRAALRCLRSTCWRIATRGR